MKVLTLILERVCVGARGEVRPGLPNDTAQIDKLWTFFY